MRHRYAPICGRKSFPCSFHLCFARIEPVEAYQIILLILVFVAFAYLAIVVYVLGQMREFKSKIKKRLKALNILLVDRADILNDMQALFDKSGVEFTESEESACHKLLANEFLTTEESVRSSILIVKEATTVLRFIAQSGRYKGLEKERLKADLNLVEDLERNFRTACLLLNGDVAAYNYWIAIPTVGWVGWLFGHRKKELIS